MSELPPTPMLDRMREVKGLSQALGEFLEWLDGRGYVICRRVEGLCPPVPYVPAEESVEALLAAYFGVDLEAAERERRAVLERVRGQCG